MNEYKNNDNKINKSKSNNNKSKWIWNNINKNIAELN